MIDPMLKVQVAVPKPRLEEVLTWLQEQEVLHPASSSTHSDFLERPKEFSHTEQTLAQLHFVLDFISRIRKEIGVIKKKSMRDMFAGKPTADLAELERVLAELNLPQKLEDITKLSDAIAKTTNDIVALEDQIAELAPWRDLPVTGENLREGITGGSYMLFKTNLIEGNRLSESAKSLKTAVLQPVRRVSVGKKQGDVYWEALVMDEDAPDFEKLLKNAQAELFQPRLEDNETIGLVYERLLTTQKELQQTKESLISEAGAITQEETKLQFAYDALLHKQERILVENGAEHGRFVTVLTGWIPERFFKGFTKAIENEFLGVCVQKIAPNADEEPPVAFRNSSVMQPFESVTNIFGKPRYSELDPSVALSVFFLAGFGLALTDAGYGIVMMVSMWAAQKFFRLNRETKKMVRLLFYAGAATLIAGALTGGWFGVTLEELPPSALRDSLLRLKLVDPIRSPMVLLSVAFAIGIVQLLFAWVVRAYDNYRRGDVLKAVVDDLAWVSLVALILLWVASSRGLWLTGSTHLILYALYANVALMVLTQGRQHKNIFLRLGSGLLSLYGLVNFLSDMLSYSRLLALGLSTAIIGLVVNMLGGMVAGIPTVGWFLAAIVLLIGHVFNLGINALGAFIHSGRLQFVEFFPKFLEGGGVAYKPFGRVSRFVENPNDYKLN